MKECKVGCGKVQMDEVQMDKVQTDLAIVASSNAWREYVYPFIPHPSSRSGTKFSLIPPLK
jgi:hypothetical protein